MHRLLHGKLLHGKWMYKILTVAICLGIMLSFGSLTACTGSGSGSSGVTQKLTATQVSTTSNLGTGEIYAYFSVSDSLNPYEAETEGNQQLASLMFDGLTRLDKNMNAELMLAQSIEINGKTMTATLKNVKFSDGSAVSASDVTYSLELAKNADNKVYSNQLSAISSYYAENSSTIVFTLKSNDPLAANLLDFPIIKQGSTNRKNDDDKDLPPIGCGRYVYTDESGTYKLSGNENYYGNIPLNTITLDNTPDKDALQYSVKAGDVDIYYSGVMTGDLLSMSGKNTMVKQTNFVFLGVNETGDLVDKNLRCAVSSFLDRNDICKTAYYNYSESAKSVFNNGMDIIKNCKDIFSATDDTASGESYMKSAGYTKKDTENYYIDSQKKRLSLNLLYNSQNAYQKNAAELIVKQMKTIGIEIVENAMGYKDYLTAVTTMDYDLYLGEIMLNKDFDLSVLYSGKVVPNQTLASGATSTEAPSTTTAVPTSVIYSTDEDGDRMYNAPTKILVGDELKNVTAASAQPTTVDKAKLNEDMAKNYSKYLSGSLSIEKFLEKFKKEMPYIPIAWRLGVVSYNSNITPAAIATVSDAYYNIEYLTIKK